MPHELLVAACTAAATALLLLRASPFQQQRGGEEMKPNSKVSSALDEISTTCSTGGGTAAYETRKAVEEYLQFHYAAPEDFLPYKSGPHNALDFMARCAQLSERHCEALQDFTGEHGETTAIDVGCAVGRGSFELARVFTHVLGIDYSSHFIEAAKAIQLTGETRYSFVEEGEVRREGLAQVPKDIERGRVRFAEGDACALPTELAAADCVLAANLLCRLPDPRAFLGRCRTLVKPGGVLVLVSPYSWLKAWTPKENWLGGYVDEETKAPVLTRETLIAELTGGAGGTGPFEIVAEGIEMPFLIREHARKFQWGCSEGMVFKRRYNM